LLLDLSLNMQAVVSLRLLRGGSGRRIPAVEILLKAPYVSDLIAKDEVDLLKDAMKSANNSGMQTFDDALYHLYHDGKISFKEVLTDADSRNDLQLRVRLSGDKLQVDEATEGDDMHLEPQSQSVTATRIDPGTWIDDSIGGPKQHEKARKIQESQSQ
jgi:twitching motility protein PilU